MRIPEGNEEAGKVLVLPVKTHNKPLKYVTATKFVASTGLADARLLKRYVIREFL